MNRAAALILCFVCIVMNAAAAETRSHHADLFEGPEDGGKPESD